MVAKEVFKPPKSLFPARQVPLASWRPWTCPCLLPCVPVPPATRAAPVPSATRVMSAPGPDRVAGTQARACPYARPGPAGTDSNVRSAVVDLDPKSFTLPDPKDGNAVEPFREIGLIKILYENKPLPHRGLPILLTSATNTGLSVARVAFHDQKEARATCVISLTDISRIGDQAGKDTPELDCLTKIEEQLRCQFMKFSDNPAFQNLPEIFKTNFEGSWESGKHVKNGAIRVKIENSQVMIKSAELIENNGEFSKGQITAEDLTVGKRYLFTAVLKPNLTLTTSGAWMNIQLTKALSFTNISEFVDDPGRVEEPENDPNPFFDFSDARAE